MANSYIIIMLILLSGWKVTFIFRLSRFEAGG